MIKEAKRSALATLKGHWGMAILLSFVYVVIVSVAGSLPFLVLLFGSILTIGYWAALIHAKTTQDFQLEKLFDGFKEGLGNRIILSLLKTLFIALWSLLLVIPGIIKSYSWVLAEYISYKNPEKTYKECLKESAAAMNGHKWGLFLHDLSFIGWAILCCFTLGIGFLWLVPYQMQSQIEYINKNVCPLEEN